MEFNKYTISKKGFIRKSFEIYENDVLKYTVSAPGWIGYKYLVFKDIKGTSVLVVEKINSMFKQKFELIATGALKAELTRTFFSGEYTLESEVATYTAQSNWLANEYTIYLGDDDIAKISRKFFSDDKQYGIAIIDGNHDVFILGMIVCIEIRRMTNQNN